MYKSMLEVIVAWVRQQGIAGSAAPALREVPLLVPLDLSQIDWTQRSVEAKLMTLLQCMEQWSSPVFGQFEDIPRTRWLLSFALPYEMEFEDCQSDEKNLRCFPFETLLNQPEPQLVPLLVFEHPACSRRHIGGCQNYGRFLGTLHIRSRIIVGIQQGTMIFYNHPHEFGSKSGGFYETDRGWLRAYAKQTQALSSWLESQKLACEL
ncbi:tetA [Symbiodinium pilosum]|uniref:TetA protein n=1 Tax=Symbiodinium pilosum TaxID=2952 RepID=A0A812MG79_SYMPI|nr:tetA [Symbiodinium pilosum]